MLQDINEKEYDIKEVKLFHGKIRYELPPKQRECECCSKVCRYESLKLFAWKDKDGYRRTSKLCRACIEACVMQLKLIGRRK